MWPLVQVFIDIAFHRRGPEDLPAQAFLLYVVMLVAFAVSVLSLLLLGNEAPVAMLETVLNLGVVLVFYRLVLTVMGRAARFHQTVTALLGTSVLLSLLAMPLLATVGENAETMPLPTMLLLLGLLLWSLDISAFILSRALDARYVVGLAVALGFFIVDGLLRQALTVAR